MNRTSMHPLTRDLRPAPQHSTRAFHSAQRPAGGGREHAPALHDLIHAPRIDDKQRRAMRARAKFTWALTDNKPSAHPECRQAHKIASPIHWRLVPSVIDVA